LGPGRQATGAISSADRYCRRLCRRATVERPASAARVAFRRHALGSTLQSWADSMEAVERDGDVGPAVRAAAAAAVDSHR